MTSDDSARYLEVDVDFSKALRLSSVDDSTERAIERVLSDMPVRPYRADRDGMDPQVEAYFVGTRSAALQAVIALLVAEREAIHRELDTSRIAFEIIVCDANFRVEAKHVVVRLYPKDGTAGSVMYGLRVQRFASDEFAVWSDL
jgi:hypothetical protein